MEVKATIINMPESKMQTMEFEDWYIKKLQEWGGVNYKLNRETLVEDIENLNNQSNVKVFEHGIVVPYVREAMTGEDTRYDEEFNETPTESANMFIFDNGEVYYVHEGYNYSSDLTNVPIKGQEFDTSQITENIKSKLGKEYEIETKETESKGLFSSIRENQKKNLVEKKKEAILSGIKNAIKEGKYVEETKAFDPETSTIVEQASRKIS